MFRATLNFRSSRNLEEPIPTSQLLFQLRLATANALSLTWQRPTSNGEAISHYQVDTGTSVIDTSGPDTNFLLDGLRPDTAYTVRVRAIPPPTPVVASAVAAVTSTSESTHCALADGLGLGEGLADAPAEALAAGSGDCSPESSSGSGEIDSPKLGEALGS